MLFSHLIILLLYVFLNVTDGGLRDDFILWRGEDFKDVGIDLIVKILGIEFEF